MSNPKELTEEKVKIYEKFLDSAKAVQDIVPKVQKQLEIAKWEMNALTDAPESLIQEKSSELKQLYNQDLQLISQSLPQITIFSQQNFDVSSSAIVSTSAYVYNITTEATRSAVLERETWGITFGSQYESLQNKMGREQQVRCLIHNLKEELATEFDKAVASFQRALAGIENHSATGIAIRNVLGHYKGEVMNIAREHPRVQKVSWRDMAERLICSDQPVLHERFLNEENTWKELQQELSIIAKSHENIDNSELQNLFTRFIDHLYIVLNLIKDKM